MYLAQATFSHLVSYCSSQSRISVAKDCPLTCEIHVDLAVNILETDAIPLGEDRMTRQHDGARLPTLYVPSPHWTGSRDHSLSLLQQCNLFEVRFAGQLKVPDCLQRRDERC